MNRRDRVWLAMSGFMGGISFKGHKSDLRLPEGRSDNDASEGI